MTDREFAALAIKTGGIHWISPSMVGSFAFVGLIRIAAILCLMDVRREDRRNVGSSGESTDC